jgi:hypothetical protein
MKNLIIVTLLSLISLSSFAESLTNCKLYINGKHVEEIETFGITDYTSSNPIPNDVDGNLVELTNNQTAVTMSFSNECDNMYIITFSNDAIKKAKAGEYKTLIGKADIGDSSMEKTFVGVLKCEVH